MSTPLWLRIFSRWDVREIRSKTGKTRGATADNHSLHYVVIYVYASTLIDTSTGMLRCIYGEI